MDSSDVPDRNSISVLQPTSVNEVEELILQLYSPGPPRQIVAIQDALQKVQRSQDGWDLADILLQSIDNKVRFFGALTFIVKLNLDGDRLDDGAAETLLFRLLTWLIRLTVQSEGPLVVKKICSTLVTYFVRFPVIWGTCVRSVVRSLFKGQPEGKESGSQPLVDGEIYSLSTSQAIATLWFTSTLIEEVSKIDSASVANEVIYNEVAASIEDIVTLLRCSLSEGTTFSTASTVERLQIHKEGLACLQAWLNYLQRSIHDSSRTAFGQMKVLMKPALRGLLCAEVVSVTLEVFADILLPGLLDDSDNAFLTTWFCSEESQAKMRQLQEGNFDEDTLLFGRALLAFGERMVEPLIESPHGSGVPQIMSMLHGLLICNGVAIVEDEICSQALDFWSIFVETVTDRLYAEEDSKDRLWFQPVLSHITQVIDNGLMKIRMPSPESISDWDSDSMRGFKDFRKDYVDLLQSSYPLLGVAILQKMTDRSLFFLANSAWIELEATLFCLNALADSIGEGQEEDANLARLLGSDIFVVLSSAELDIPQKTRQTAIDLLGYYAAFCERHAEFLPGILTFLFRCLETPSFAGSASRSIFFLCRSCRKSLISETSAFLLQYDALLAANGLDDTVKERLVGAIASIIQAEATEDSKKRPLQSLLDLIKRDVVACCSSENSEAATAAGLVALRCLVSAGKAFQELEDVPIDLDSDRPRSIFWDSGAGRHVQDQIVEMVDAVIDAVPFDGDIIEAACSVYRTGFTESAPGPFVFSPQVTTRFLLRSTIDTPGLGLVLTTACAFLSSHSLSLSSGLDNEPSALLRHMHGFIQILQDPSEDPEVAYNSVDFMARLMPSRVHVLVQMTPPSALEDMLLFTLKCLRGRDILPKRAGSSFWATFITLQDEVETIQWVIDEIIEHLGPLLAEALVFNFAGEGSRSELDTLTEPLKSMVTRQKKAKAWLETALFHPNFPSNQVDASAKRAFLLKVMFLRGGRGTMQAARDFWLSCRGTKFTYAS
ncbi:MAG: hypothetical protein M1825_000941 [Sarcosagium campestre]|nr:MAG: hypothetical protein M1825_000941 [Sarcosagium campestre]